MAERDIRRRLLTIHPPDAIGAERRGWSVVRAAFEEREPVGRTRPRLARPLLALALALALVGAVVNPPVLNALRDALGRDREKTVFKHALFSLPAPGRLLVNTARGPWIVQAGGSKRLLGAYREASWSPRGLFVTALGRHEVMALEPNGTVRWSLARPGRLEAPRWSPEIGGSTRIAYLRDDTLRVVAGDGTGDRLLSSRVAGVAPAWRPGSAFALAYAGRAGRVQIVEPDSQRAIWRSGRLGQPIALAWSGDGERLLVLLPHSVAVFTRDGKRIGRMKLPGRGLALASRPGGHEFAVVVRYEPVERSAIVTSDADRLETSRRILFAADGAFQDVAWSPDGRWVLTGWRSADAWMFIGPGGEQRVYALGQQFSSGPVATTAFPAVPEAGWCCPPAG